MRLPVKKGLQVCLIVISLLAVNVLVTFLQEIKQTHPVQRAAGQNGGVRNQEAPKLGRSLFERSRQHMLNESLDLLENGTAVIIGTETTASPSGIGGAHLKTFLSQTQIASSKQTSSQLQDPSKNNNNAFQHGGAAAAAAAQKDHHQRTSSSSNEVKLSEVFISVKTTKLFHQSRIPVLLDTWVVLARDAVHFFTDSEDEELKTKIGPGRLINTNCSATHSRSSLCCKTSVEFDYFLASKRKWFCHVDDDTYVNIPGLLRLLKQYNSSGDWYLGKPSINHPLETKDIDSPNQKTAFWFGTGGAGFCLSRGLALKMMPYAAGGKLKTVCMKVRLPDDCSIGFIVYHYLKKQLTVIPAFHSHLEGLWRLKPRDLENHLTFSYGVIGTRNNIIRIAGFSESSDPTRFRSIHCHLYPNLPQCANADKNY